MGKLIVVKDAAIQITSGKGKAKIISLPSDTCKINNKGVYRGELTIAISNYAGTGFVNGAGTGTIKADALYTTFDGQKAILVGASATFNVNAQTTSTPSTQTVVPCTVQIVDAGQSEVTGE